MKKLTLFFFGLIMANMNANAQYFHTTYGDYSVIGNGAVARYTGSGHILGGCTINPPPALAPVQSLVVTRTDVDGDFTSTANFNNVYVMYDGSTGTQLQIIDARIVEYASGGGYGALGSYVFVSGGIAYSGVFYMKIDALGNPIIVRGYVNGSGVTSSVFRLVSAIESSNAAGDIFAVGTLSGMAATPFIFVMRIDNSGALVWSYIYNYVPIATGTPALPADILEVPGKKELMVVGKVDQNGLWIVLDPTNGVMVAAEEYNLGGDESFSSIALSNDPLAPGFILSGSTNVTTGGNYEMMAVKTAPNRAILWSNSYSGPSSGVEQMGRDVVGRLNTSGSYEYYMVGQNYSVPGAASDIQAFKINAAGNSSTLDLFEYPISGTTDLTANVDINDNTPGTGLSIYSTNFNPIMDMHITKAYFNGITPCSDTQVNASTRSQSFTKSTITGGLVTRLKAAPLFNAAPKAYNYNVICYDTAVASGSNLRGAAGAQIQGSLINKIYPNPLTGNASALVMEVGSEGAQSISITLTDMLGKVVYTHSFSLSDGSNQLKIDLGNRPLASGVYNLTMQSATLTENHKVSVE